MSNSSTRASSIAKSTSYATLDDEDNFYLEAYLDTGHYSVSPIYQPSSPHFSGVTLTMANESVPDKNQSSFSEEDRLHAEKRIAEAKIAKEALADKRKSRQKRKSEMQFDSSNDAFDLSNFHFNIFDEPEIHNIDLSSKDDFSVDYDLELPDPVISEKLVPKIIGYIEPATEQNRYTKLKDTDQLSFSEDLKSIYSEKDLDSEKGYLQIKQQDENLFRDRRLFQLLQFRNRSDPIFIKNHFPIENDRFFETDVSFMFDLEAKYLTKIKNQLQALIENTKGFKSLFYGSNWFQRVKKVLDTNDHRKFSLITIAAIYLVFDNRFLSDFHLKLDIIDNDLFRNSIFKNLSLYDVFNHLGIIFVNQFCQFKFFRPYIINLVYSSHSKTLELVQKQQNKKKKKMEETITSEDVLEFYSKSLFPTTVVERKGTGFKIKEKKNLSSVVQEFNALKDLMKDLGNSDFENI